MARGRPRGRDVRGDEIYRRRVEAGLTKAELARNCNVSARYVADQELERYPASLEMLYRLAGGLGCTVADLVQDPASLPFTETAA